MKLLVKFNAILIPVLGIGLVITAYYSRSNIEANAFDQVKDQARLIMESAQASRDYTSDKIKPLLHKLADLAGDIKEYNTFHPEVVPAYAARTTFEMLHNNKKIPESLKRFIYREPSDNPTLFPQDLATWEKDLIELFRNDRELIEKSEDDYMSPVGETLYLARPIKVVESCMACHDKPENAPPAMVKQYGDHGFGWNVGDIAAVKIVSVPRSVPEEMTRRAFIPLLTKMGFVAALTFLILNVAMIMIIIRPVARLSAWADEVSKGDLGRGELQVVGSDEISKLTSSFNRLYLSLLNAMDMLRKK